MRLTLPEVLAVNETRSGSPIRQLGQRKLVLDGAAAGFTRGRLRGVLFQPDGESDEVLLLPKTTQLPDEHRRILQAWVERDVQVADLTGSPWLRHPLHSARELDRQDLIGQVLSSWAGAFSYVAEDAARGVLGLRGPQLGALHAVHAHWSVSDKPATVVMPTGTGKTETMLSLLLSARCARLLVIVPTDALRSQLAGKFTSLGVLRLPACGALLPNAKYPIVCTLLHLPRNAAEVDDIFGHAQVIITTSSVAGQCARTVQDRMAHHCPYLFIDEAHHAVAAGPRPRRSDELTAR